MKCKKCSRHMVLRVNNTDDSLFLGCSGFPLCRATQRYTPGATEVRATAAVLSSMEMPPSPQTFQQQREVGMTPSRNEAMFSRSAAQMARQLEGGVIVINDSDSVMLETPTEEEEEHPAAALWLTVKAMILAGIAPEAALASVVPSAGHPSLVTWLAQQVQGLAAEQR